MAVEKISQERQTFRKNNVFQLSTTYTLEKRFLQLLLLKVCESFRLGQLEMYFGLYESSFTFIEKRQANNYCLCEVNLISYMQVFSLMGEDANLARKISA